MGAIGNAVIYIINEGWIEKRVSNEIDNQSRQSKNEENNTPYVVNLRLSTSLDALYKTMSTYNLGDSNSIGQ
jgi:hypothetical protein